MLIFVISFFVDLCLPLLIFVDGCWCVLIFCDIWRMLLILIIGEHQKGFLVRLICILFPPCAKDAYLYYLFCLLMWCTCLFVLLVIFVEVIYMIDCIVSIACWRYLHVCLYSGHNLLMWFACSFALFPLLIYMFICFMFITCWCDLHASLHYDHNLLMWFTCLFA